MSKLKSRSNSESSEWAAHILIPDSLRTLDLYIMDEAKRISYAIENPTPTEKQRSEAVRAEIKGKYDTFDA